jgi:hypothetical protein
MNRIITVTVACLAFCGLCFAEAPESKPTVTDLSDAQLREVQKYRSDQRSKEEKRIEYLTRRVADMKQKGSDEEQQRAQEILDGAKKDLERIGRRLNYLIWRDLEQQHNQEGRRWQEPTPADNGELVEGKWVQVLTLAQLAEARTRVRKETDLIKERSQLRFERKEAMASGDKGKAGLIDGRLLEIKDRVPIPVLASPIVQWEAIVKEQSRRGLEWHERPTAQGQESTPGSWEPRGQK